MRSTSYVDFAAVRAAVSVEMVLEHYGVLELFERTENGLKGPSPFADSDSKPLHVNTARQLWYCHATKQGGNQLDLVATVEQVPFKAACELAIEWFGVENAYRNAPDRKSGWGKALSRSTSDDREEPKGRAPARSASTEPNKPLSFELKNVDPEHEALAGYRVSAETLAHFGAGFYSGRGFHRNRLVFPIENAAGELVGYGGIDLEDGSYVYPDRFRPELELYNLPRAREAAKPDIAVVTDPHEVWELYEGDAAAVVATMSAGLGEVQRRLLEATGIAV